MKNPKTNAAACVSALVAILQGIVLPLLNDSTPSMDQIMSALALIYSAVMLFKAKDTTPTIPQK